MNRIANGRLTFRLSFVSIDGENYLFESEIELYSLTDGTMVQNILWVDVRRVG